MVGTMSHTRSRKPRPLLYATVTGVVSGVVRVVLTWLRDHLGV
jgi:hypothetical protein